jgi:hypothetical protein
LILQLTTEITKVLRKEIFRSRQMHESIEYESRNGKSKRSLMRLMVILVISVTVLACVVGSAFVAYDLFWPGDPCIEATYDFVGHADGDIDESENAYQQLIKELENCSNVQGCASLLMEGRPDSSRGLANWLGVVCRLHDLGNTKAKSFIERKVKVRRSDGQLEGILAWARHDGSSGSEVWRVFDAVRAETHISVADNGVLVCEIGN